MKYIVFWHLLHTVSVPCSESCGFDEFGRTLHKNANHVDFRREYRSRSFIKRDSATAFYTRGKNDGVFGIRIDSVRIKK